MVKRPWWLAGVGLAALAAVMTRWPAVNDVTTGRTPEYPDLQPHRYSQGPPTVFQAVQRVAKATRGCRVTAADTA
jgi:hypothetical protein